MEKSKEWPRWHTRSLNKWNKIIEKTEAGERFNENTIHLGFYDLSVWMTCAYCEKFENCNRCPLNQKKVIWRVRKIPICANRISTLSITSLYAKEMQKPSPDREKAIKLAKIVRDEIAKDKPFDNTQNKPK